MKNQFLDSRPPGTQLRLTGDGQEWCYLKNERRKKIIALQILGFFFENCYIIFIFFDNFLKIHYF